MSTDEAKLRLTKVLGDTPAGDYFDPDELGAILDALLAEPDALIAALGVEKP